MIRLGAVPGRGLVARQVAMGRYPHVVLIVETSSSYGRRILRGITRYLRPRDPWSVFFRERDLGALPPAWLRNWRGDGIICRLVNRELAEHLRRAQVPVVNLNDVHDNSWGLPRIQSDHRMIGQLAAEHLLERGFHHFAFCGFTGHEWSGKRGQAFVGRLRAAGFGCDLYESPWGGPGAPPWEKEQEGMGRRLQALPRPVGVMACNDVRGQQVLDACRRVGLSVPEEVAVIGADNDELLCDLCHPPLSSVVPNPEGVGYEAAALLDRLMAGAAPPAHELLIEPLGVTTRQSSDVLAVADPQIAAAMRFIREHACQGLSVADILKRVPLSRTALERQFRKYLGRSPQAEIRAVQIKRVKQLLGETDMRLSGIARAVGFQHPEYLSVVFKRETGETPGQFRRKAQPADRPHPTRPDARRRGATGRGFPAG
jgi:LacI family transcriptional regulator